ncbi:hypothetical protein [Algoriphagus sp. A40]|uniref:hypothetical protein n=1 Tax=Algoriphagus sp. A40 TaxID=1945863 RepID=UPI00098677B2|nr:hypothetical protein [Algoriphagus sp. A40]OOG76464.1 hypothetical protein B0E43_08220 [Algoriphagus sp. A40]
MRYLDDWRYREEERIRILKQQEETDKKIMRGFRIFIGGVILCMGFFLLNDLLGKSSPVTGTVLGYSFSKGRWEGPPSMFTDQPSPTSVFSEYREDAYEVSLSLESGEVVSFLCFSCDKSSYQIGDSDTFLVTERWVGRPRYSEKR